MENKLYYLVEESALPDYLMRVAKVKEMVKDDVSISYACKKNSISRSTFYKYKDMISKPENKMERKLIMSIKFKRDIVLGEIVKILTVNECNILSLNQFILKNEEKLINLVIDTINLKKQTTSLINELKNIVDVNEVEVIINE